MVCKYYISGNGTILCEGIVNNIPVVSLKLHAVPATRGIYNLEVKEIKNLSKYLDYRSLLLRHIMDNINEISEIIDASILKITIEKDGSFVLKDSYREGRIQRTK